MKAKRLTALALAALMAASTTSVALASERVDADLDFVNDGYYKYNSDTNRLESAKRDEFQPGDDVYLRLVEDSSDTFTNKKTYNAYADWTIGDSWVKDIDVVYRKGEITTPGSSTTKYVIKDLTDDFASLNGTELTANTVEALKAVVEGSGVYTTKVNGLVESKYKATFYTVDGESPEHYYKESEKNAAYEKAVDLAVDAVTVVKDSYGTVDGVPYKGASLPSNISKKDSPSGYIVDGVYYDTLKDAMAKVNGWYVYNSTNFSGKTLYDDTSSEYGTAKKNGSTPLPQSDDVFVNVSPAEFDNTQGDIKFIKTTCLRENVVAAVGSGIEAPSATVYCDTSAGNKVVTVKESVGEAYFKQQDSTFLADATQKATAGEKLGTVKSDEYYKDGSGNKTDRIGAEAAAKAEVNATLNLTTANIDSQVTTGPSTSSTQYEYWVKITTKDSATTKDIDVVGSIWVGTSKSSAKKEKDGSEDKFRADFTLTNSDPGNDDYDEATDYVPIEPGERAVVSFADDASDEFEVEFGDDAYFVFNARGQGKLNLAYNTKYNKDFAYDYDDANIDFINFEGEPTTNRTGTLYIYADEDSYIYEVTSKGAKKINGAYYDDDEEAWVIRTRNLTSYAISDKKLKTVDQMDNGSSSNSSNKPDSNNKPGNGKPNPDTGR